MYITEITNFKSSLCCCFFPIVLLRFHVDLSVYNFIDTVVDNAPSNACRMLLMNYFTQFNKLKCNYYYMLGFSLEQMLL